MDDVGRGARPRAGPRPSSSTRSRRSTTASTRRRSPPASSARPAPTSPPPSSAASARCRVRCTAARRRGPSTCSTPSAPSRTPGPYLVDAVTRGEKIMGFGHRVYKTDDPRSVFLRGVAERIGAEKIEFAKVVEQTVVDVLAELKPGRNLYANVEFYAGVVMDHCGLPAAAVHADVRVEPGDRLVRQHPRAGRRQPHHPAVGPLRRPAAAPARARRVAPCTTTSSRSPPGERGPGSWCSPSPARSARPSCSGSSSRGRSASSPGSVAAVAGIAVVVRRRPGHPRRRVAEGGARAGRPRGDGHRRRHRPRQRTDRAPGVGGRPRRRRTSASSAPATDGRSS